MRKNLDFTITKEAFPQCWEQVDAMRRKSRVMSAVASIGGFWTNLFLLLSVIAAANGMIYEQFGGPYADFLRSIPMFIPLWEKFSGFLLNPGDSFTVMAVKLLLAVYVLSILFFLILSLIIRMLYHPGKRQMGQGTYAENTALLFKATQDARAGSYKTRLSTSLFATLIAIVTCLVLLFAYTFHVQNPELIASLLSQFPTGDPSTNCLLYVLIGYFVCGLLTFPLLLTTRFIYRYEFPMELVVQAEREALYAKENLTDLPPEELAQHCTESAASLREEAISLEKEGSYGAAKVMLQKAALFGDTASMEHYARHCLILHLDDSARYWLEQAQTRGELSKSGQRMLLRMKLRLRHRASYLRPDAAPLSTGAKIWRAVKLTVKILFYLALTALFALFIYALVRYIQSDFDPDAIREVFSFLN